MVTYNHRMESEGAAFSANSEKPQGRGARPLRKKGLRLPLSILFLFALALSVAFPYGIGLAVFVWVIALIGALIGVGFASYVLLKELLGKTATFGYAPTMAYLAGKKTKKRRKAEPSNEQTKKVE